MTSLLTDQSRSGRPEFCARCRTGRVPAHPHPAGWTARRMEQLVWQGHQVIDADGHVMEPLWLWAEYLDPVFRENRLRVVRDARDGDNLLIDGVPSRLIRRLGGSSPSAGGRFPTGTTCPWMAASPRTVPPARWRRGM